MIYQPVPAKRCTDCHQWFPSTTEYFIKQSGTTKFLAQCRVCRAIRAKAWRQGKKDHIRTYAKSHPRDLEKKRAADRFYAKNHKDQTNIRRRTWKAANPDKVKAANKRRNPESTKKAQKNFRTKYPERRRESIRKSRKAKPELYRSYKHIRRAREKNVPATFTPDDWNRALIYFNYRCAICGNSERKLSQDHWIPVVKNGAYTPDNILPLCMGKGGCNQSKGDSDPIEWLYKRFNQADEILARIEQYFKMINRTD